MKNVGVVGLVMLALAGCASPAQVVQVPQYKVVQVPQEFFTCPVVKLPDAEKATNRDVAKYIVNSHGANLHCRKSLDSVQQYLNQAKATIEKK